MGAIMSEYRLILASVFFSIAALLAVSCGTGPAQNQSHNIQSLTLTPTTADAEDYPNGQVPFVATGHYNIAPLTVTPQSATWGACDQFQPTNAVSVSQTGVAQCSTGASGTYTVWANDPLPLSSGSYSCPAYITGCGGGCVVQATAQIKCP
jgi:hypothetical protein